MILFPIDLFSLGCQNMNKKEVFFIFYTSSRSVG